MGSRSPIDRVAALLALAENTDNEHEAAAFLAKAQQLATLAAIDLELARSHRDQAGRSGARRETPISRTVQIGERGRRANKHMVELYLRVAGCNDVRVDISHYSTYVIGYGYPSDLDVVQTIWASVAQQMVEAAAGYLATGRWRGETYRSMRDYRARPHTAQTARAAFYQGYIGRVGDRLREARKAAVAESDAAQQGGRPGSPDPIGDGDAAAVVLRRKSEDVTSYYATTSSARGSWGGYAGGASNDAGGASRAGRAAGDRARLGSPQPLGQRGRLT
jgi:hypothetical protein